MEAVVATVTAASRSRLPELVVLLGTFALLVVRVPTLAHFLANADHGFQLAAGAQVLDGRVPGIDSLHIYGPLLAVLAVATGGAAGDLVGEALFCAAAWATTIWLVFRLVRGRFGPIAGSASAVLALLCIARFHKWYVWLIPIAALACLDRTDGGAPRRSWWWGGTVCGLGALLRPELGVASLAVLAVVGVVDGRGRDAGARLVPLAVGFALPIALWMAALVALAGPRAPERALAVTAESVLDSARHLSMAPPSFQPAEPLGKGSAHALALVLLPLVDVIAIVVGVWWARERAARRLLAAIGLMGLAVYPHTIHRADLNHFWQGAWPLVLALPALGALAASERRHATAAAALAVACALPLGRLIAIPHRDLARLPRAPLAGLAELRRGVAALPNDPNAQVVRALTRLAGPDDEILVAAAAPQLPVLARRRANGLCVMYQRGLFDSPEWRREHVAWLERHPPAFVVATTGLADTAFRLSQPEMWESLHARYTKVVAQIGALVVLAPRDLP